MQEVKAELSIGPKETASIIVSAEDGPPGLVFWGHYIALWGELANEQVVAVEVSRFFVGDCPASSLATRTSSESFHPAQINQWLGMAFRAYFGRESEGQGLRIEVHNPRDVSVRVRVRATGQYVTTTT